MSGKWLMWYLALIVWVSTSFAIMHSPPTKHPLEQYVTALRSSSEQEPEISSKWKKLGTIATLSNRWVTMVGERLLDPSNDQSLEYWRVEKEDSAVVVTMHRNQLVFPVPMYRPGIGEATLDFPGGRVPQGTPPNDAALGILQRELGLPTIDKDCIGDSAVASLQLLNSNYGHESKSEGWPVNSSFSNQRLWGFFAELSDSVDLSEQAGIRRYGISDQEIDRLLSELSCAQCRLVLLEWLRWREHQNP